MIAGLAQLAGFLVTAWLLAVAVDRCYRRNERTPGASTEPATVPGPRTVPPATMVPSTGPASVPLPAPAGVDTRRTTSPRVLSPAR